MADTRSNEAVETIPEGPFIFRLLGSLPLGGRNGMAVAAIATIIALSAMIWFATRPAYKTLYSGLAEEEAGKVVEQLVKMNVPYQLTGQGSTIQVPANKLYDIKLELATQGIPKKTAGVGFEIFDKTSLVGMTDFMQRMNYQRALQGELSHTIESITAVQKARIQLVLPKKSLFVSEEKAASASVLLDLRHPLSPSQINGIVHLVSSSVEGLDEAQVTILDQKGNMIAGGKKQAQDGRLASDESLALQRQVEKTLEERVQTMLDRVLGSDRSIIRVTAELDLSRVERQEEKFDPEGQVPRSEQFVAENSKGAFGNGGVPGVTPNDPNATTATGASGSNQSRENERQTVNYEISKTTNRILLPVGTIKRLSVAVIVDETKTQKPEEVDRLQKIIEQAVGFRQDRGDTIQVSSVAFEPVVQADTEEVSPWKQRDFQLQMAKMVGMGLLIFLLVFFVLRPLVKKLLVPEKTKEKGELPSTVADLEQQLLAEGVGAMPSETPVRVLIPDRSLNLSQQMISDYPDQARDILRFWLSQGEH